EAVRVGGSGRLVLVPEVRVYRLVASADARRERAERRVVVRRLAEAQMAEGRRVVEVVDAHRTRGGEALLDSVPGRMLEVEREPERRIERAEEKLEGPVVTGAHESHAHRAEPVAEQPDALFEHIEPSQPVSRQLRC